ncbi:MAG: LacI family DNA-binding transcriptional regulator [Opitutaceae bacterium]|nr:LacI family DNA-binding transcriptional regulator [Opitutaceae bacterium]
MTIPSPNPADAGPPERTTSYELIARRAGVSRSTVSRVLRNDPRISEATARRVREAAQQLGYRPNPLLSNLMERIRAGRDITYQGVIAVVTEAADAPRWYRPGSAWEGIHDGARQRAAERGYQLAYFSTRDFSPDGRRLSQILRTRGIHGVYVTPGFAARRVNLDWPAFSAATTGHGLLDPALHRVCYSNYHGIQLACRRLAALGYRRLGLYLEQRNDEVTDRHYVAGFLLHLEDVPPARRIHPCLVPQYTREDFLAWYRRHRPDAVISSADAVVDWARAAGLRCPEDFGFVHLDCTAAQGEFAGIDHHGRLIGRAVVDLIIAQIHRGESGVPRHAMTTIVEGGWIDGPSVRPQGRAAPRVQRRA